LEKIGSPSIGVVRAANVILDGGADAPWYRRLLPFMGPAFVASVAYIDPGNFATNIQGGAQFGYTLLWVVIFSNLIAILVQVLSAKLGIATGYNLAELCRDRFPRGVVLLMWVVMEVVAMATDLAEFLGAALGFFLLFHIPLLWAGFLTGVATFLILGVERYGFRPLEAVIVVLIGMVAFSYLLETLMGEHNWPAIAYSAVVPRFSGGESVLLGAGILGATVMPHVIFLHSALMQGRIIVTDPEKRRRLFHYEVADVVVAMTIAGAVNAAMLVMAASTFFSRGMREVGTIEEAYRTLTPLLGGAASTVFAVSLLAAGLSSAAVGTMSGQVIMQGFLRRGIPVWIRRLATMLPSLAVIALGLDPTRTLVVSQVILSFGLPFAVLPLVLFTSDRKLMGSLVNRRPTTILAWIVAGAILLLNIYLLYGLLTG
jgi:manganese transport protein